ncbi:MAG: MBL fold metallo-hydrolase [Clostridiales bacterium]|nr:MBL fold metallo-hydrolase [Clostridiales bacterium]
MPLFSNEQVTPHLKRILLPCGVCAYLAQGERRAVLIDTGFGLGDLKSYVESLVTTPYMVLLSHGHLDHEGGAGQFDMVWLNKRDWSLARRHCTIENRLHDIYNGPDGMPAGATEPDLIPPRTEPYYSLSDGDGFPLGGVTVEAVSVPGHTAGMTVFLLPEDRVALFGDACGEHTLLTKEALPDYRRGLARLANQAERFDTVLRKHGDYCSAKQILVDNLALTDEIMAGTDAAVPYTMMGVQGHLGRPEAHPGKAGNIFYANAADAVW